MGKKQYILRNFRLTKSSRAFYTEAKQVAEKVLFVLTMGLKPNVTYFAYCLARADCAPIEIAPSPPKGQLYLFLMLELGDSKKLSWPSRGSSAASSVILLNLKSSGAVPSLPLRMTLFLSVHRVIFDTGLSRPILFKALRLKHRCAKVSDIRL